MTVAIGSAFRNSSYYLNRYLGQVQALQIYLGSAHKVRLIAAEGDSNDSTYHDLVTGAAHRHIGIQVVNVTHGHPWFGSTEDSTRLKEMSKVGNAIFNAVRETDDILVYVESDLVWNVETIGELIRSAIQREEGYDVFAPMIFAGAAFYDTYVYRKDGERFGPFPPYHSALQPGLTEVDSVGSCLVMQGNVARECRIKDDMCLIGWCEDARNHNYRIAVNSDLRIDHP